MSLYGALYAGVAGLQAQSNKLGIISDNIANVNTVGYKEGQATFETLVTTANGATAYSPGGVISGNQQQVTTQGLLQTTSSPTDIAISGNGFFVVNQTADGTGRGALYPRRIVYPGCVGQFRQYRRLFSAGVAARSQRQPAGRAGQYQYDVERQLKQLADGQRAERDRHGDSSSSKISISANLNSGQDPALGAGATASIDVNDTTNSGISADQLITQTGTDHLTRGDKFTVATSLTSINSSFTYGGFSVGRNVTDGTGSDAATTLPSDTPVALGAAPVATTNLSSDVVISLAAANTTEGLKVGSVVTLAGLAAVTDGITATGACRSIRCEGSDQRNHQHRYHHRHGRYATSSGRRRRTVEDTVVVASLRRQYSRCPDRDANASSASPAPADSPRSALSFNITTAAAGTQAPSPIPPRRPMRCWRQFNTLTNLATAISDVSGLTARVVNNQLYVGASEANAAVTFTNGSAVGVSGPPVQAGIDWINELGLATVAVNNPVTSGTNRYSSLQSLADDVNSISGLKATVNNPTGSARRGDQRRQSAGYGHLHRCRLWR